MSEIELKRCDNCDNEIPSANYSLHMVMCIRHTYRCEKCGESVSVSGREEHELMRHTSERCSLCGERHLAAEKADHFLVCLGASEVCEFCESEVRRGEMREHRHACGSRTELCHSCPRYVLLRDKDTHTCHEAPQPISRHDFHQRIGTVKPEVENLPFANFSAYSPEFPRANFDIPRPLQFARATPPPVRTQFPRTQFVDISGETDEPIVISPGPEAGYSPSAPCEFCGNQVPLMALEGHQERCQFRNDVYSRTNQKCPKCGELFSEFTFAAHNLNCRVVPNKFDESIGSHHLPPQMEPTPEISSNLIPCEFCNEPFEMDDIHIHQISCQTTSDTNFPETQYATKCEFCDVSFTVTEIGAHRGKCMRKPAVAHKFRPMREAEMKCKYCLEVFQLEELQYHQNSCSKRHTISEEKKCRYCFEGFPNDFISNHENICSLRSTAQPDLSLDLPFRDNSRPFKENPKSTSVDNKCPFCKFPQPAMDLERHKKSCQKNPRFKESQHFENQIDFGFDISDPELKIHSRPIPVNRHGDQLKDRNVPASSYNPFLETNEFTRTDQRMELTNPTTRNPIHIQGSTGPKIDSSRVTKSKFPANDLFPPPQVRIPQSETVSRKYVPSTHIPEASYGKSGVSKGQIPKSDLSHGKSQKSTESTKYSGNSQRPPKGTFKPQTFDVKNDDFFAKNPPKIESQSSGYFQPPPNTYKAQTSKDFAKKNPDLFAENTSHKERTSKNESQSYGFIQQPPNTYKAQTSKEFDRNYKDVFGKKPSPKENSLKFDSDRHLYSQGSNPTSSDRPEKSNPRPTKGVTDYKLYSRTDSSPVRSPSPLVSSPDSTGFRSPTDLFRDSEEPKIAFSNKQTNPKSQESFHMELKFGVSLTTTKGTSKKQPATIYSSSVQPPRQRPHDTQFAMNPELVPSSRLPQSSFTRPTQPIPHSRGSDIKHPRTEEVYSPPADTGKKIHRPPMNLKDSYLPTVLNGTETIFTSHQTPPKKQTGPNTDKYKTTSKSSQTYY